MKWYNWDYNSLSLYLIQFDSFRKEAWGLNQENKNTSFLMIFSEYSCLLNKKNIMNMSIDLYADLSIGMQHSSH